MTYTFMQLVWLFFLYSFIGWCGEVCVAAFSRRKFINRGFVNSPFCPIYGFGAVLFAVFLPELTSNLFFLFLAGMTLATVLEYITGLMMEKIFHQKLWDYSSLPLNLDGYICLPCSLLWGLLAILTLLFLNPILCRLFALVPHLVAIIVLWGLSGILLLDFLTSAMAVLGMKIRAGRLADFTEGIQHTSRLMENTLTRYVQRRMQRSFPILDVDALAESVQELRKKKLEKTETVFAEGCSFYKLVSLFFIGAFLGDITETIFCLITTGRLMSRSSVVYGPFSVVWGLGCALLTLLLYRYKNKSNRYIFLAGTLLGGVYEYVCSVFTELVFGTVFWDYSGFTFNVGGRVNLLYCFFWGVAAVLWLKAIYPFLSRYIEKLPRQFGTLLCNCLIIFMIYNALISSLALARYTQRNTAPEAAYTQDSVQQRLAGYLDGHFPDERMERIYPNAKIVN